MHGMHVTHNTSLRPQSWSLEEAGARWNGARRAEWVARAARASDDGRQRTTEHRHRDTRTATMWVDATRQTSKRGGNDGAGQRRARPGRRRDQSKAKQSKAMNAKKNSHLGHLLHKNALLRSFLPSHAAVKGGSLPPSLVDWQDATAKTHGEKAVPACRLDPGRTSNG